MGLEFSAGARVGRYEIGSKGDNSIQMAVETRDTLKHPLDQLTGRNMARPYRVGEHMKNCRPPTVRDRQPPFSQKASLVPGWRGAAKAVKL